jgi:GntR family transcriptional repressor for pyruvate dehydrogenase complex
MADVLITGIVDRPPKTWVRVAERLQELILSEKLAPGSKLPPERVLCQQLGVSRTVLREAVKLLSARGLVYEVNGKGTFVSKPNLEAVKKSLEICLSWHAQSMLENLVELRRLIEVEIAGLAAAHATKAEIASLRQNVREMEFAVDSNMKEFVKLDLAFHLGLAKATHNELFVMLFEAIAGAMVGRWEKMYWDPKVRGHGIRFHKKILGEIERRDPAAARGAVRKNIEAFRHDVLAH